MKEEYIHIIRKFVDMANKRDFSKIDEILHSNAVLEIFRSSFGEIRELTGINEIRHWYEESQSNTDGIYTLNELLCDGQKVVGFLSHDATYWEVDKVIPIEYSMKIASLYTFKDLKIIRQEVYYDSFSFMKHLGIATMIGGNKEKINQYLMKLVNSGLVPKDHINFAK